MRLPGPSLPLAGQRVGQTVATVNSLISLYKLCIDRLVYRTGNEYGARDKMSPERFRLEEIDKWSDLPRVPYRMVPSFRSIFKPIGIHENLDRIIES